MSAGRGIVAARAVALLVLGALGLHQPRFLVAFGLARRPPPVVAGT